MKAKEHALFVRWVLLNALLVVGLVALAASYGGKIHGPSLVAIPAILAAYGYGSGLGGRICWEAETQRTGAGRRGLRHRAEWLGFWAWVCQILGILSTVLGFWLLLTAGGTTSDLGTRIQSGGGVALTGTFVGILASLALTLQARLIDHDLGG